MQRVEKTLPKMDAAPTRPPRGSFHSSVRRRASISFGLLQTFWLDEEGQDMVEYTLLLSFIVVCAVGVMTSTRTQVSAIWSTISSALSSAVN